MDVDLYADLEDTFLDNPFLDSAVVLPAPSPSRAVLIASDDIEDNDDVQRLVEQLHAAKDSGLDAEFDLDADFGLTECVSHEEVSLAKKPREDSRARIDDHKPCAATSASKAKTHSKDLDSDFEFEDHASDDEAPAVKKPRLSSRVRIDDAKPLATAPASKSKSKEYWYNPVTNRWETRDPVKEAEAAKLARSQVQGRSRGASHRQLFNYKTDLCWQFKRGLCKKGSRCYWAHGSEELRSGGDAEHIKKRVVAECVAEARADANAGACEYPQALVVRIALRFEEKLNEILPVMAQAGLPASADHRTTVKALMRLCHPDKCHHPEAKKAMQILGPLLGKR